MRRECPVGQPLLAAVSSKQLRPEEAAGETGRPTRDIGVSVTQDTSGW
jgi:hypothetical protein